MKRNFLGLLAIAPLSLLALPGCSDDAADEASLDGKGQGSCSVEQRGDGTARISCPDGTEVIIDSGRTGAPGRDGENGRPGLDGANGKDGKNGNDGKDVDSPCVLTDNPDGTHSMTCGDKSVVIGAPCDNGFPGDLLLVNGGPEPERGVLLFQVSGCTWVRGDVVVAGYQGDALPPSFARITKIDRNLTITGNQALTEATFPSLESVGGQHIVTGNAALIEASFPALQSVDGALTVAANAALEAVSFPALETIGEMTTIADNSELASIGEFTNLVTMKSGSFSSLPKLVEFPDFPSLVSATIIGWFGNERLESTGSFPKLTEVGELHWSGNPALVSTGGFPLLESAYTIDFTSNGALETIGDFPKLETTEFLLIAGNNALVSLPDLSALVSIEKNLFISDNAELTSIAGLGGLEEVSGDFTITNNPKLPICDVVELWDNVTIGGTTRHSGNDETDIAACAI